MDFVQRPVLRFGFQPVFDFQVFKFPAISSRSLNSRCPKLIFMISVQLLGVNFLPSLTTSLQEGGFAAGLGGHTFLSMFQPKFNRPWFSLLVIQGSRNNTRKQEQYKEAGTIKGTYTAFCFVWYQILSFCHFSFFPRK